jgi:pimeloyl-ACP methyl ester carboxylesterase
MAHGFIESAQSHLIGLPAGNFHFLSWSAEHTERPAIVLLHGLTSSAYSWIRVGPALADRYRVYAPDMRGHGDSVKLTEGYNLRHIADDTIAFMEALQLERPIVIGHSLGGATAIVLASGAWSQRPVPQLSRVILEDPAHSLGHGDPEKRAAIYTKDVGRSAQELRVELTHDNPRWTSADVESRAISLQKVSRETVVKVFAEASDDCEMLPFLHDIQVPTLLIGADPAVESILDADAWELAQRNLPVGSRAVRIDTADHDVHRGTYTEFMQAVNDFLLPA